MSGSQSTQPSSSLPVAHLACARDARTQLSDTRNWHLPVRLEPLKARQLGVQFRPEVLFGGRLIVDFFACGVGLVVELDGGYHARCRAADASRDRKLRRLGDRVLRVDAELVLRDLQVALALIRAAL